MKISWNLRYQILPPPPPPDVQDEREARLAGVLQMQTRAKWFEGIK